MCVYVVGGVDILPTVGAYLLQGSSVVVAANSQGIIKVCQFDLLHLLFITVLS